MGLLEQYRTPEEAVQGLLGLQPGMDRLNLLPRYDRKQGWIAPQMVYDLARMVVTPGVAATGGLLSQKDSFDFAAGLLGAGVGARTVYPSSPGEIGMNVYHGSPNRFPPTKNNPLGEFDLGKIGTGEGNQMYGHGLYVAESPEVAKSYIGAGRNSGFSNWDSAPVLAGKAFSQARGDKAKALQILDQAIAGSSEGAKRNNLEFAKSAIERGDQPWNLYTADLPDQYVGKMLDFDKTLAQQPAAVKRILQESGVLTDYEQHLANSPKVANWTPRGSDLYTYLGWKLGGGEYRASEYLNSIGIVGNRYFDEMSRDAGRGSRNFVLFDPSIAKILKRE